MAKEKKTSARLYPSADSTNVGREKERRTSLVEQPISGKSGSG